MTRLDLETMRRVSEVLSAAGYPTASAYVYTWSSMPSPLRDDMYPGQEPFVHAGEADDTIASSSGPIGRIPLGRNQPAVAELAERLAKVEARQDEFEQRTVKALNEHSERFNLQMDLRLAQARGLNDRIDKVAEIIGERISGLVDQVAALENRAGYAADGAPYVGDPSVTSGGTVTAMPPVMRRVYAEGGEAALKAAFPTGGATTAEAAADAVLPVPQRGDRVRLEGAQSVGHTRIADGWYDAVGHTDDHFQVRVGRAGNIEGVDLFWIDNQHPGLKEVSHADH